MWRSFFSSSDGEIAPVGQGGIQARGAVALGKHKAVPIRVLGIFGIDVHFFKIQVSEDLSRGEGTSRMAGLGVIYAFDDTEANFRRGDKKVLPFLSIHSV